MVKALDINALREVFDHFDQYHNGTIKVGDLFEVMKSFGKHPSEQEMKGRERKTLK